jgi:hypothetical protein
MANQLAARAMNSASKRSLGSDLRAAARQSRPHRMSAFDGNFADVFALVLRRDGKPAALTLPLFDGLIAPVACAKRAWLSGGRSSPWLRHAAWRFCATAGTADLKAF